MFILPPPLPPEAPAIAVIEASVRRISRVRMKAAVEHAETVRPPAKVA